MKAPLIMLIALATAGCVTPGELRRQRLADEEAEFRRMEAVEQAQAEARRKQAAAAEADRQAALKREQEAEYAALVERHRRNNDLLVVAVGPACIARPGPGAALAARSLADLAMASQCMAYSSTRAEIQITFLNSSKTAQVKDLRVQCILVAPSGTVLGSPAATTIYDKWEPGEIRAFTMEMPLHPQAKSAICERKS